MFSKLQIWILTGCLVITTVGFALFAFRTSGPLPPAEASASSTPEPTEEERVAIPHGTLKPYPPQHSPSVITKGNDADEKIIDAAMAKLGDGFKTGDWAAAIDFMYTPLLERLGGRKKALESIEALKVQMKDLKLTWSIKKPYTYVAGKSRKYVIIPYEAEGKMLGVAVKQAGYELGIKTASGWQFVGGDQLSSDMFEQFFPDFPKDVELPELQQVQP